MTHSTYICFSQGDGTNGSRAAVAKSAVTVPKEKTRRKGGRWQQVCNQQMVHIKEMTNMFLAVKECRHESEIVGPSDARFLYRRYRGFCVEF